MRAWMNGVGRRAATVVALSAVAAGGAAATAHADSSEFGIRELTAGAFSYDGSTPVPYTQAGGHPDVFRVKFMMNNRAEAGPDGVPPAGTAAGLLRNIDIEMPTGFQGSAIAVPRCKSPTNQYTNEPDPDACPKTSIVGAATLFFSSNPMVPMEFPFDANVYSMEPPEGVVARYAFMVLAVKVFIDIKVNDDGRYTIVSRVRNASQGLVVRGTEIVLFGTPAKLNGPFSGSGPSFNFGQTGGPGTGDKIPMLTMSNDCDAPQKVKARAQSWQSSEWKTAEVDLPPVTGCDKIPVNAALDMAPETNQPATPSGFTTELRVPQQSAPDAVAPGLLKKVEVKLPQGVAINPGSAQGLVGCTDAQIKLDVSGDPECPDASKIGTVKIDTPALPGPLDGFVYVGQPKSQQAANGDMFRVFLGVKGHGVTIKQEGRLTPDPVTGQLTAVFDKIPQQPFERMTLKFNGGPRAPLTTPTRCGEHATVATITATTGKVLTSTSTFNIACRDGLFGFSPSFAAGVDNILAGASSPFRLSIAKGDGQRALTGVNVAMPKGLLANLKGNLGRQIGSVRAYSGLGSEPFGLPGTVVLEGPYGDAPFSLRVTVPAKAGPYDLGDVVVRQKLYVNPDTAQVTTVSDPLPTILQGVPVQLQRLDLSIDKSGFMINPTSCQPQQIGATLTSEAGQSVSGASNFGIGGCGDLKYAPKLDLKVGGELKNGGHPQLDATLTTQKGEANQKQAQVTLPLNLALDPKNAKALCEPSQAAGNSCPAESIVGKASAISILDVPLEGPVYFVRGERTTSTGRTVATLPKLFIPLKGQGVTVNVHASSDVVDKKLQTTFDNLPDAPIERFDLTINGGANGILKVTNGDVCKTGSTPKVGQRMTGQNGKVFRSTSTLGTTCAFGIAKTARKGNRLNVTVAGLTGGRVTVSGKGLSTNRRTFGASSTVANVGVSLNAASQRALQQGRTLRIRVKTSFKPNQKGAKTVSKTKTVVVKPTRKAAR